MENLDKNYEELYKKYKFTRAQKITIENYIYFKNYE